jgi:hypothetical protein
MITQIVTITIIKVTITTQKVTMISIKVTIAIQIVTFVKRKMRERLKFCQVRFLQSPQTDEGMAVRKFIKE